MFKIILSAITIFTFLSSINAAESVQSGTQPGIYISEMKIQPAVIDSAKQNGTIGNLYKIAQSLDTQLTSALSATRVFQVVERKRVSEPETEQAFASVAVDANDKDAAKMGEMAGAKFVLLPVIDGYEELSDKQEYNAVQRTSVRRRFFISASVSIVDTTTGRLLSDVPSVQLTQDEEINNSRNNVDLQNSYITIVELAKKAANMLCQEAVAFIRPAKILSVDGTQVLINRGTAAGFNEGLNVTFYALQNIKDEDSGEIYSNEVPVGSGTVTRANNKQSYAKINEKDNNLGIAPGCVVKYDSKPEQLQNSIPQSAPGGSFPQNPEKASQIQTPESPGSSEKPLQFNQ